MEYPVRPLQSFFHPPASPLFLFVIWTWELVGQKLGKGTHRKGPISDQADSPLFHLEEPKTRKPSTDQICDLLISADCNSHARRLAPGSEGAPFLSREGSVDEAAWYNLEWY